MNTNTADAGSAAVTGQPEGRQLRRSGDDRVLAGVAGIVALTILSITVHVLLSPWMLVVIAVLAWIKFRPRRSRR